MKKSLAIFTLITLLASSLVLHADSYNTKTNLLTIPSIQVGTISYSNVVVNLGSDYQILSFLAEINLTEGSVNTVDNYNAINNLLTVPLVTVNGNQTYQNVTLQLGKTFQLVSVAGCTGCSSSVKSVSNLAPLLVDNGPIFNGQPLGSVNVAYTSVTICQSATANCQTFDHIMIDTGSSGFRVLSPLVAASLNLTTVKVANGSTMVECTQFVDGYTWGTVKLADVKIAGEVAANIPIQIIGDNAYTVPLDCSSSGVSENTVDSFGANGILGIGNFVYDCGILCANQPIITGAYYACSGSSCQATVAPLSQQVSNPVAFFSNDNNGTLIQFPSVVEQGATNISGSLIFGIDTQSNNNLGGASIFTLDVYGQFTTIYKGKTLPISFLDSGSSGLFFNDRSISQCQAGYCPSQTLSLSASIQGQNSTSATENFSVANATDLVIINPNGTAFSNLAYPTTLGRSFDWGLPFFYGRSIFTAIENRTAGGIIGPYVAY